MLHNIINDGKCYTTSYDEMKNKIYHTRKNSIFNRKMVERDRINIFITQIHNRSPFGLVTCISINKMAWLS